VYCDTDIKGRSLCSRRLEVGDTRKNGCARRRHASVLSFAHYFQAPATQAKRGAKGRTFIFFQIVIRFIHNATKYMINKTETKSSEQSLKQSKAGQE